LLLRITTPWPKTGLAYRDIEERGLDPLRFAREYLAELVDLEDVFQAKKKCALIAPRMCTCHSQDLVTRRSGLRAPDSGWHDLTGAFAM
jgi:hypothetical protein